MYNLAAKIFLNGWLMFQRTYLLHVHDVEKKYQKLFLIIIVSNTLINDANKETPSKVRQEPRSNKTEMNERRGKV